MRQQKGVLSATISTYSSEFTLTDGEIIERGVYMDKVTRVVNNIWYCCLEFNPKSQYVGDVVMGGISTVIAKEALKIYFSINATIAIPSVFPENTVKASIINLQHPRWSIEAFFVDNDPVELLLKRAETIQYYFLESDEVFLERGCYNDPENAILQYMFAPIELYPTDMLLAQTAHFQLTLVGTVGDVVRIPEIKLKCLMEDEKRALKLCNYTEESICAYLAKVWDTYFDRSIISFQVRALNNDHIQVISLTPKDIKNNVVYREVLTKLPEAKHESLHLRMLTLEDEFQKEKGM